MGIPVMILGESGSGKSASMRNFTGKEIGVINVSGKPLPFRSDIKTFRSDDYMQIDQVLRKATSKSIVIDDAQYLMSYEFMRRSDESGFQKFTDIGKNFWALVQVVIRELPDDVIVYFMCHSERDQDGNEKAKTIGKLLDEKITLEGMFTIVLKTKVIDGQYRFRTQTSGRDTVKSPIGLFDEADIENDLKLVDRKIREYYELNKNTKKGEKQ
jgi:hypothetical protein